MAADVLEGRAGTVEAGMGKRKRGGDDMEALEATLEEGTRLPGFVSEQPPGGAVDGGLAAGTEGAEDGAAAASAANPEDIVLDDAEEDEDEGGEGGAAAEDEVAIEQKDVPNAVFGSVGGGAQPGALERFKKRRTADADV